MNAQSDIFMCLCLCYTDLNIVLCIGVNLWQCAGIHCRSLFRGHR